MNQAIEWLPIKGTPEFDIYSEEVRAFASSGMIQRELVQFLHKMNGAYSFGGALLLRPFQSPLRPLGLKEWNSPHLWKAEYADHTLDSSVCFAEDAFGCQFVIKEQSICQFDGETSEYTRVAESFSDWQHWIASDSDVRTGWPLLSDFSADTEKLLKGYRLVPSCPFVLGGEFSKDNLICMLEEDGMQYRAQIARQIRNLPDGSEVVIHIRH